MTYKNLSELKEKSALAVSAADIANLKLAIGKIKLSTLYKMLYTNAEFRLNLIAEKIHELYPAIPEEYIKTNMSIWEIAANLAAPPPISALPNPLIFSPREEYKLYLSIIFEIFFLPFYIVKTTD